MRKRSIHHALAEKYPQAKVAGVDYQGERLWVGARAAKDAGITNCFFLRARVEMLPELLPVKADQIWITFPDPFPKDRHAKRRLTSAQYLKIYEHISSPGATVCLKTDAPDLFAFTRDQLREGGFRVLEEVPDVDALPADHDALLVETDFETRHREQGRTISFLRWEASAAQ
ncbi:MAG: tRNA (guanine-N(7)-)-methyltransferase [candidate division WS6 bacterium OLB20]|uniref:tRNA (guanine(46)-N(7))-methyltransferase n=1 Tax=candidate division WS6 bacterium OLB20 TaxID=1617426 RepID=A0A136M006_9BACT|nr:MAG: tRNA (guanine-N(7)-)-methyltransferase [candidate division WS6 bacterium OLB20]